VLLVLLLQVRLILLVLWQVVDAKGPVLC